MIRVSRPVDKAGEEVWSCAILCIKNYLNFSWEEMANGITAIFNEAFLLEWMPMDYDRALVSFLFEC